MDSKLSTALVAELIGTFALIFFGAGAAALNAHPVGIALAHGFVLVGIVYAYGHISGAHVNPAVTLGVWAAGEIKSARALSYIVVQLIGGVLGALVLRYVVGGPLNGLGGTHLAQGVTILQGMVTVTPMVGVVIEAIFAFFLANTVLGAAVSGKTPAASGIAIGLTLAFIVLMGMPLTGASANPARSLGPAVATGNFDDLWVYFAGPAIGGLVAGWLYKGVLADRA